MSATARQLVETMKRRARAEARADADRAAAPRRTLEQEVGDLPRAGLVRRAWPLGSLAWGGFGARSDVDLVVEGLPASQAVLLWARPGDRSHAAVDLLRLEDLPGSFRARVLAQGVAIDER